VKSVVVVAIIACALACPACSKPQPESRPTTAPAQAGKLVYHISAQGTKQHPVTITDINHGQRDYFLEAATVVYATNLQQGMFHDTLLHFFKGAKPRLTVTAPVATVDENTHNVDLSGGVVARTAAGDTLVSDTMTYNEKTRLLTAVGHVVAIDPLGYRLTGTRAIADLDLEQIQLFGNGTTEANKH
jgi:LPS export ABC transporter protein LptC